MLHFGYNYGTYLVNNKILKPNRISINSLCKLISNHYHFEKSNSSNEATSLSSDWEFLDAFNCFK